MVLAYHIIITAYGFWLPNDPRGSWSDFIGAWELLKYGRATKTTLRHSLAKNPHDRQLRIAAKRALKYPPVIFDGPQARAIARGFADFIDKSELAVFACSIMPDHIHLVIGRHHYDAEQMMNLLKGAASRRLELEQLHPLARFITRSGRNPKAFARGGWKVYLNTTNDILRDPLCRKQSNARGPASAALSIHSAI